MIRRGLALLGRARDFRFLMATQWLAQAGDGLVQGALASVIAFGGQKGFDPESARSPEEVLRIVLYTLVPYTVLSPFLGVVIDRWDRRRLLLLVNALRSGVVLLVALWGTGRAGDLALFLAFLLTLMSTRVVLATKSAALPSTVDPGELVEANALSQLGGAMFQLGGLGIALLAHDRFGPSPAMIAGGLVYALAAAAPLAIGRAGEVRVVRTFGQELARVARSIWDGLREVVATPKAGASITTYFWLRYLWSFTLVGIGFVARELLDDDLTIAALTGGSGAAGAVLGFLLAARLSARAASPGRLVLAASAVAGAGVTLLGGIASVVILPVLTFVLGFGFFLAKISLDTMVQQALGDDFRGRAFSLYDIAYNVAWVLAAAVMKVLWTEGAEGALIAGMGAVFVIGLLGLAAWFRRAGLLATS